MNCRPIRGTLPFLSVATWLLRVVAFRYFVIHSQNLLFFFFFIAMYVQKLHVKCKSRFLSLATGRTKGVTDSIEAVGSHP